MKHVNCYLCGSDKAEVIDLQDFEDEYLAYIDPEKYAGVTRAWKSCSACGLAYHDPRLDEDDVTALYTERYRRHSLRETMTPDEFFDRILSIPKEESENYEKVTWLKPRVARHLEARKNPAILDIGCSAGMLIKMFRDEHPGWGGAGVEPTVRFAEVAQRRVGVPVKGCAYRSGMFGRTFDLITMVHVLEHILDPLTFLAEVRRDLSDTGLVFIEVPDVADFSSLPPNHDRFMSPHIHYFSARTIERLLRKAGYYAVEYGTSVSSRGHANLRILCKPGNRESAPAPEREHDALKLRRAWSERVERV